MEIDEGHLLANMDSLTRTIFTTAKYFTVVVYGSRRSLIRIEVENWSAAIREAKKQHSLYNKGVLIYAVGDIKGCENMTRHICNYPYEPYITNSMRRKKKQTQ